MNNNTLRIGTRKSRLAMVQTEIVREVILAHFPFLEVEIVPMSTKGDQILDRSLTSFGGKGVFTKELEEALLRGDKAAYVVTPNAEIAYEALHATWARQAD